MSVSFWLRLTSSTFRYAIGGFAIAFLTGYASFAGSQEQPATPASTSDPCYLQRKSGVTIPLQHICGKGTNVDIDKLDPRFVKLVGDYRSPSGDVIVTEWEMKAGGTQPYRLPDGMILYPDGTVVEADGTTFKPIVRDKRIVGTQYYKQDGTPASPGEVIKTPSGRIIRQQAF
jgi:hypothetical protein